MTEKTTVPAVTADFIAYFNRNPTWGVLHIVLDDLNLDDESVRHCVRLAQETGDAEGERLARVLLGMSKTQRKKLSMLPV